MIDLTKVPLSDEQIMCLVKLGVKLFHDFKDRETYISEAYWSYTHPSVKRALIAMVTEDQTEGLSHE